MFFCENMGSRVFADGFDTIGYRHGGYKFKGKYSFLAKKVLKSFHRFRNYLYLCNSCNPKLIIDFGRQVIRSTCRLAENNRLLIY